MDAFWIASGFLALGAVFGIGVGVGMTLVAEVLTRRGQTGRALFLTYSRIEKTEMK